MAAGMAIRPKRASWALPGRHGRAGREAKPGLPYLIACDLRESARTTREVGPSRLQHAVMVWVFGRLPRSLAVRFILGTLVMNKLHGPLVGTHVCADKERQPCISLAPRPMRVLDLQSDPRRAEF